MGLKNRFFYHFWGQKHGSGSEKGWENHGNLKKIIFLA